MNRGVIFICRLKSLAWRKRCAWGKDVNCSSVFEFYSICKSKSSRKKKAILYNVSRTVLFLYHSSFRFKSMLLPHEWALRVQNLLSVVGRKAIQISTVVSSLFSEVCSNQNDLPDYFHSSLFRKATKILNSVAFIAAIYFESYPKRFHSNSKAAFTQTRFQIDTVTSFRNRIKKCTVLKNLHKNDLSVFSAVVAATCLVTLFWTLLYLEASPFCFGNGEGLRCQ